MKTSFSENRVRPGRSWFFLAAMVVLFVIFTLRLAQMQLIEGEYYFTIAESNRTQPVFVPASRGVIYDRNGVLLARNMPSYNITITPAELPDTEAETDALFRTLSQLTGVPIRVPGSVPSQGCAAGRGIADLVDEWIELAPYNAVKIQCDANPEIAKIVLEKSADMPGVGRGHVSAARDYPNGRFSAHVVGYMGRVPAEYAGVYEEKGYNLDSDKIGYAGIEAYMEEELAGSYGSELWEVDAAGKHIRLLEPPPGSRPREKTSG